MKINDHFLQNCLYWLTEISLCNRRINQMQKELEEAKVKVAHNELNQNFENLRKRFDTVLNKLKETESSIIFLIKNNASKSINSLATSKCKIESEKELFELMKALYNSFIELQRSSNYFFTQIECLEVAPKVINLQINKRVEPEFSERVKNKAFRLTRHA